MRGSITGRDVMLHPVSIVRHWGMGTYFACLWAALTGKQTTFLRVLYPAPGARRRA
jgi:hypothetical protein